MVTGQAIIFLIFITIGIIIGIVFDIFRIFRKTFNTPDIVTYIEDIIFWLLTGLIIIYSIFVFNNGEIRLYMFLAVILGCLIYMLLFSKFIINICVKILTTIIKILRRIISIISIPIITIIRFLKNKFFKPISFIIINFKKMFKNFINQIKKIFKFSRHKKTFSTKKTSEN